jgi:hypothetical protein
LLTITSPRRHLPHPASPHQPMLCQRPNLRGELWWTIWPTPKTQSEPLIWMVTAEISVI